MGEKMKKIWGLEVFAINILVWQGKCLKLKILGLSLVAFGAQRMIVKFKLVHSFFLDHSK